ncbi:cytochrome P450 [Sphingomonas sp. RB3P16]|uniref:cytochrome P450 n=1 Tax=Parasphingomonas frigoris TaxID=3096163 RepID=UPI002FC6144F
MAMLRYAISDPARVIPASIFDDWSYALPGPRLPIVIAEPDAVRHVLLDTGETFGRNRPLQTLMRRAWGTGLAAAEGESWAAQRRAAAPAFRPKAIDADTPIMATAVRRAAERWPCGDSVDLQPTIGKVVVKIVLETLLSGAQRFDTDAIAADIPEVMRDVAKFGLLEVAPIPAVWLDRLRRTGRSKAEARLRHIARDIAADGTAEDHQLAALLRNSGPLADNIFGFMIAGFETSALGAAWALYLLALHPEWQAAVRAEARAAQDQTTRPIARAVVQEALRLYPPGPLLVRAATRDTELLGHRIYRGQAVIIAVFAIHRHRQLWGRPDTFDPNRFQAGQTTPRGAYLPFGAGPRLCIAAGFATAEITTIVSGLVRYLAFTASGAAPIVSMKVSTHSTTGLHVTAQPVA